jgi:type I restriction enzyme, S subunit
MNVLLSVKPQYIESILNGDKKYEFRKQMFKRGPIDLVFIYASSPIKKIVGYFKFEEIIEDHPKILWTKLSEVSGLNEDDFFNYFKNKDIGYAIKIDDFKKFSYPAHPNNIIKHFHPPQSFCYVELDPSYERILKL